MRSYHSQASQRHRRRAVQRYLAVTSTDSHIKDEWITRYNWNKRRPLDCGRARCLVCHGKKVYGLPTWKERRERERFNQMLQDAP